MTNDPGDDRDRVLDRLGSLVGLTVQFQGMTCLVADLIVSPALLILKPVDGPWEIQSDAYGTPRRRGPRLIEIPVFAEDGHTANPELKLLRPGGAP
jgi:hypothetical protein